jgi:hypothetical protein
VRDALAEAATRALALAILLGAIPLVVGEGHAFRALRLEKYWAGSPSEFLMRSPPDIVTAFRMAVAFAILGAAAAASTALVEAVARRGAPSRAGNVGAAVLAFVTALLVARALIARSGISPLLGPDASFPTYVSTNFLHRASREDVLDAVAGVLLLGCLPALPSACLCATSLGGYRLRDQSLWSAGVSGGVSFAIVVVFWLSGLSAAPWRFVVATAAVAFLLPLVVSVLNHAARRVASSWKRTLSNP